MPNRDSEEINENQHFPSYLLCDLNYSQPDMFELFDEHDWILTDQKITEGTYHFTFSTPNAFDSDSYYTMSIDPSFAKNLINKRKYSFAISNDGSMKILNEEDKIKDFKSKNKNNIKTFV